MTIIAFISQKGGVGKSTLAQALAIEAKKQGIKILLADCDSFFKLKLKFTASLTRKPDFSPKRNKQ
jgi:cellulose biosynthesis protein BcsQ